MALTKPKAIEADVFKSAKWDELTEGRNFTQKDAPTLALLCQWYAVIESCIADMDYGEALPRVAYGNDLGDIKAMPQLSTMKQASAEIRALNKQLGIDDAHEEAPKKTKVTRLEIIQQNRLRKARTANSA